MQAGFPASPTHPLLSSAQPRHLHPFIMAGVLSRGGYCSLLGGHHESDWAGSRRFMYLFVVEEGASKKVRQFNRSATKPTVWGSEGMKRTAGVDKGYTAGHMATHPQLTCVEREKPSAWSAYVMTSVCTPAVVNEFERSNTSQKD